MRLISVALRDFRSYASASAAFGEGLTVITGVNGAGKTNLLEAVYFGCTGRSCRTANDRELVGFGASATRVLVRLAAEDGAHELAVGFAPGEPKRLRVDGAGVERLIDVPIRPLLSVFLPDRLELVKGAPALRRAHLDQLAAALWPARRQLPRRYAQALAQRNALLARVRLGGPGRDALDSWDEQLARCGLELMRQREAAVAAVAVRAGEIASQLGLSGPLSVRYRPRSRAREVAELRAELRERLEQDIERGFTAHGPHRDELALLLAGREARVYASQGQQRLALLALLLAEREAIAERRPSPPVLLLDDVMSELDEARRRALIELVCQRSGQAIITATELDQVPAAAELGAVHLVVEDGVVRETVLT